MEAEMTNSQRKSKYMYKQKLNQNMNSNTPKLNVPLFIVIVFVLLFIWFAYQEYNKGEVKPAPLDFLGTMYSAPTNHLIAGNAPPILKTEDYPAAKVFEDNWEKIRDEFMASEKLAKSIKGDMFFGKNLIETDKWRKLYIKWYGGVLPGARKHLPFTSKLVEQNPEVHLAMFSYMLPGTVVHPHTGISRACVRGHLGLKIPNKDCQITIDGKKYDWEEGKMMIWDDTYVHSVENKSKEPRLILFLDFKRKTDSKWKELLISTNNQVAKLTNVNRK